MPITNGAIWCHVPYEYHCATQELNGPLVVFVMLSWSAVMPFCASAITASQFTAVRSCVERATFARMRAL